MEHQIFFFVQRVKYVKYLENIYKRWLKFHLSLADSRLLLESGQLYLFLTKLQSNIVFHQSLFNSFVNIFCISVEKEIDSKFVM